MPQNSRKVMGTGMTRSRSDAGTIYIAASQCHARGACTLMTSEAAAGLAQIEHLRRRILAPQNLVPVRKASEAPYHRAMAPSVIDGTARCPVRRIVAQPLEQRDGNVLVGHRLRMLEGQVEE